MTKTPTEMPRGVGIEIPETEEADTFKPTDLPVSEGLPGEGEDENDDGHAVPGDLLELHEVIKWQTAVAAEEMS